MVYEQEKIKPYKQDGKKGEQVEQMFDHIAHSYDQLNHRLSWNIDKMWRNAAIKKLAEKQPQTILDVATGTGDFAIKAAEALKPAKVLGIDIISHTETAGLGAVSAAKTTAGEAFRGQFAGCSGEVSVAKDGGGIDAITGATITSRAICTGVNAALACVAGLN